MIFIIISFPYILYQNISITDYSRLGNFLILYSLFPIILSLNMLMCKFKFRNKKDLKIDYTMLLVYPLFMKIKFLMNVFGFLSCIVFFIPFETYFGFYNLRNYTFKEEDKSIKSPTLDEIDMEEIDNVEISIIDNGDNKHYEISIIDNGDNLV